MLRFLAAPTSFQKTFAVRGAQLYGIELKEGYCQHSLGLELFLAVGADALWAHDFELRHRDDVVNESILRLYGILSLHTEYLPIDVDDWIAPYWDAEPDDGAWQVAIWRLMQDLARQIIERGGLSAALPDATLTEIIEAVCWRIEPETTG
jgi:hypothetical protein